MTDHLCRPFSPEEIRWLREIAHWKQDCGRDSMVNRVAHYLKRTRGEIFTQLSAVRRDHVLGRKPTRALKPRLVGDVMIDDFGLLYRELMAEIYAQAMPLGSVAAARRAIA